VMRGWDGWHGEKRECSAGDLSLPQPQDASHLVIGSPLLECCLKGQTQQGLPRGRGLASSMLAPPVPTHTMRRKQEAREGCRWT